MKTQTILQHVTSCARKSSHNYFCVVISFCSIFFSLYRSCTTVNTLSAGLGINCTVVESNWYAAQNCADNFNLTKKELKVFLATLILSGYHTTPRQAFYWCRDENDGVPLIQQKLLLNRFRAIKLYLHLAENTTIDKNDRLAASESPAVYKFCIRLLSQFGVFTNKLSINEKMVSYYRRSALKQYIRGKPIKVGVKL